MQGLVVVGLIHVVEEILNFDEKNVSKSLEQQI